MKEEMLKHIKACSGTITVDEDVIDSFIESFLDFQKSVGETLDNLIKDEISIKLPSESQNKYNVFFKQCLELSRILDDTTIFAKLSENENNQKFWNFISKITSSYKWSYDDSTRLRNLKYDDFCKEIKNAFQKRILFYSIITNETEEQKTNILKAAKIIDYCIFCCIERRYDFLMLRNTLELRFDFTHDKIDFLWKLINDNKTELYNKILLDKLNRCDEMLDKLNDKVQIITKTEKD